jgi:hypothetical protein
MEEKRSVSTVVVLVVAITESVLLLSVVLEGLVSVEFEVCMTDDCKDSVVSGE